VKLHGTTSKRIGTLRDSSHYAPLVARSPSKAPNPVYKTELQNSSLQSDEGFSCSAEIRANGGRCQMSTVDDSADRTPEHEENERQAAAFGVPYPELTRTLRCNLNGINYKMFAAIMSWSAPADDWPGCDRCGYYLDIIAPNLSRATAPRLT
jgi:hypothetical protein